MGGEDASHRGVFGLLGLEAVEVGDLGLEVFGWGGRGKYWWWWCWGEGKGGEGLGTILETLILVREGLKLLLTVGGGGHGEV